MTVGPWMGEWELGVGRGRALNSLANVHKRCAFSLVRSGGETVNVFMKLHKGLCKPLEAEPQST